MIKHIHIYDYVKMCILMPIKDIHSSIPIMISTITILIINPASGYTYYLQDLQTSTSSLFSWPLVHLRSRVHICLLWFFAHFTWECLGISEFKHEETWRSGCTYQLPLKSYLLWCKGKYLNFRFFFSLFFFSVA